MGRMVLVAATETPREEGAPIEPLGERRFHAVVGVEEVWSGDGRYWEPGAYVWRDLPLPFMADDENHPAHENAKQVGLIDTVERQGAEIHAWGPYVNADDFGEDADRIRHLQGMIDRGELRGVSADMDDPEWEVVIPADMMSEGVTDPEGNLHMKGSYPKEIYSSVRIIGATALPFPALQECFVEPVVAAEDDAVELEQGPQQALDALGSSANTMGCTGWVFPYRATTDPIVASAAHPWIKPPVCPPASFFDDLVLEGPTPWTVTADGELLGHLALWGQCHIGRAGECITPPASRTDYAHYHLGEVICDDGTRIACGNVTLDGPHADLKLALAQAAAHYDHTGTQVAQIRVGEDRWGIWCHGALCPDVTASQVRKIMASPPSGDWRRKGGSLELVAVLHVNVPGFPNLRKTGGVSGKVYEHHGLVASLVLSTVVVDYKPAALGDDLSDAVVRRIAASIGRAPHQRIAALRDRVHGGR